ncbi:hypothetical protein Syun_016826 [Stephania yunnanensis]|uniref:PHD finger protein ALFIN-LIKE n=1 Tax=Stephania yunnanensis TaxID=152371 RepID=A0AAP0J5Y2_9MAGN
MLSKKWIHRSSHCWYSHFFLSFSIWDFSTFLDFIWAFSNSIDFIWVFSISLDFIWVSSNSLDFIRVFVILLDFIWVFSISLDFIWVFFISLDFIRVFVILLDFIWVFSISLDFIWVFFISLDFIWIFFISLDFIWVFSISLDFIGFLSSWSQMRRNLWPFVILIDCLLCVDSDGVAWEVTFPPSPSDVPPPDHPEPAPGVNCKLDDTVPLSDWLLQIALQCDSWLQTVVSHLAAQFDIADRDCLLTLANTLSPVYQAVALSMGIGLDGENESKTTDETTREGVRIHKQCGSSLGEKENETAAQDQGIVLDGGNESKIPVETTGNGMGVHKECGSSSEKDNEF